LDLSKKKYSEKINMTPSPITRTTMPRAVPTKEPKRRMRKCAVKTCRAVFEPRSMTHKCCGPECALLHAQAGRASKDRKERQEGLAKLKRRADWLKDAQTAFNAFVRARDASEPCISCGRHHNGQYHAGHFRSVGAQPALRFNESNVHKQCAPCNNHLSGNVIEYRIRLIGKIGAEAVAFLETEHAPRKWTIEELQAIKALYRQKLKQLKGA
jgi:hypothetical protein